MPPATSNKQVELRANVVYSLHSFDGDFPLWPSVSLPLWFSVLQLNLTTERTERKTQRATEELEKKAMTEASDYFPEPVRLEIEDVFDLHTIHPRDLRRAVVAYLEEARVAEFRSVRIIHGKGRGVQREAVREILAATKFVRAFADAPPQAGGLGATIAHLAQDERRGEEER